MKISATVRNTASAHEVELRSAGVAQKLPVQARFAGRGSSFNGGELLMLALAMCYCNDLFHEAARLGIAIESAQVEAAAEFAGVGLARTNPTYLAKVNSPASQADVARLLRETDAVAEVHNTLRAGVPVDFEPWQGG